MRNVTGHKISFFAVDADGVRTPRTSNMANGAFRWEATCACGFATDDSLKMAEADRQVLAHKLAAFTDLPDPTPVPVREVVRIATTGRMQWGITEDGVVVEKYRSNKQALAAY